MQLRCQDAVSRNVQRGAGVSRGWGDVVPSFDTHVPPRSARRGRKRPRTYLDAPVFPCTRYAAGRRVRRRIPRESTNCCARAASGVERRVRTLSDVSPRLTGRWCGGCRFGPARHRERVAVGLRRHFLRRSLRRGGDHVGGRSALRLGRRAMGRRGTDDPCPLDGSGSLDGGSRERSIDSGTMHEPPGRPCLLVIDLEIADTAPAR